MKALEQKHNDVGCAVCGVWLALFSVALVWFPCGYVWLTYEDCLVEWAQVFFCAIAWILFLLLARRDPAGRWLYLTLAVGCFYVFGEEISWGQRLLAFDVPELFMRGNLQQETNLHNFLIGPYDTLAKHVSQWLLAVVLGSCGMVILFFRSGRLHEKLSRLVPYWPARYLGVFILLAALLEWQPWAMNESEWAETFLCYSVAAYALYCYGQGREARYQSVALAAVGLVAAGLISLMLLAWPATAGPIRQRVESGKRLFAQRYQHKGWLTQSDLLLDSLRAHGYDNAWVLRAQAKNQRLREPDTDTWQRLLKQAVAFDLAQLEQAPLQLSRQLSLFEDYAQLDDRRQAEQTLASAVRAAKNALAARPDDGDAWYWMGRIYTLVGRQSEALSCFERAVAIDPKNVCYRQASYSLTQGDLSH